MLKDRRSASFRQKMVGMMLEVSLNNTEKVLKMLDVINKYVAAKDLDKPEGNHIYFDDE